MDGRSIRSDSVIQPFSSPAAHGTRTDIGTPRSSSTTEFSSRNKRKKQQAFKKRQKLQPDRVHQPMPCLVRSKDNDKPGSGPYCKYEKCPGFKSKAKVKRPYKTIYQCEQCTVEKGFPFWLCHTAKKVNGIQTVVSCHLQYHAEMCYDTSAATECSVVSELTNNE